MFVEIEELRMPSNAKKTMTLCSQAQSICSGHDVVETMSTDAHSTLYRARRADSGELLLVKVLDQREAPELESALHLREVEIAGSLRGLPIVPELYEYRNEDGKHLIFYKDHGGIPLSKIIRKKDVSLAEKISIAIKLATAVGQLHRLKVLHNNLSPSSVLYHPQDMSIMLTGLGYATFLATTRPIAINAKSIDHSMMYTAPEQVARITRPAEPRSDLYAVGMILYELFTGRTPYSETDFIKSGKVLSNLQVPAPSKVSPEVPAAISDIIMKLIERSPKDRYQSSKGLKADLQKCLHCVSSRKSLSPFPLGDKDLPESFHIPEKLYGREMPVQQLRSILDQVDDAFCSLVLVTGDNGIGKSTLIRAVFDPASRRQGNFIEGRFSTMMNETPYSGFVEAIRSLFVQLLSEDEPSLARWRDFFSRVMAGKYDELCLLFPEVGRVWPDGAYHRKGLSDLFPAPHVVEAIIRDIIVFASEGEVPFIVALDEIQNIDTHSLRLIMRLLDDDAVGRLLLVAALNPQQLGQNDPLHSFIENAVGKSPKVVQLTLEPLSIGDIGDLLHDAFRGDRAAITVLAKEVHEKTAGVPGCCIDFIAGLVEKGIMVFNPLEQKWTWDGTAVRKQPIMNHVSGLIHERMALLATECREILDKASCIGMQFELGILTALVQRTTIDILTTMKEAIVLGIICEYHPAYSTATDGAVLTLEDRIYSFTDESVWHSLYERMTDETRLRHHHKIASILLKMPVEQQAKVFQYSIKLCHHLSRAGGGEVSSLQIAKYNLSAYYTARLYARDDADAFLSEASRSVVLAGLDKNKELFQHITLEQMWIAYDGGQIEAALTYAEQLLGDRPGLAVYLYARCVKAATLMRKGQFLQGMREAAHVARSFAGILRNPLLLESEQTLNASVTPFKGVAVESDLDGVIQAIKFMIDNFHGVSDRLVRKMLRSGLGLSRDKKRSLDHDWFVIHDTIMQSKKAVRIIPSLDDARYAFERLMPELAPYPRLVLVLMYYFYLEHWKKPLKATAEQMIGASRGQLAGELTWLTSINAFMFGLYAGLPISHIIKRLEESVHTNARWQEISSWFEGLNIAKSRHAERSEVKDGYQRSDEFLRALVGCHPVEGWALSCLAMIDSYLHGEYEMGKKCGSFAASRLKFIMSSAHEPMFRYHYSMLLLGQNFKSLSPLTRLRDKIRIFRHMKVLKKWAGVNPDNYLHRYLLVKAGYLALMKFETKAVKYYEKAIEQAIKVEATHDLALGCEHLARFYLSSGHSAVGHAYLQKAKKYYLDWGALVKVRQLTDEFSELNANAKFRLVDQSSVTAAATHASEFDNLKKSLVAISSESIAMRMMERVLQSALEFSGAQRGLFLLSKENGRLFVEVEGDVQRGVTPNYRPVPFSELKNAAHRAVNFVKRTGQTLIVSNTKNSTLDGNLPEALLGDPYLRQGDVKSLVCLPLLIGPRDDQQLMGMLYLENKLLENGFAEDLMETLRIIALTAAGKMELSVKAAIDGLTGLYNHEQFQNMLQREFLQAGRQMSQLSLLMVDIDHFKKFNDTWGHQAGDLILKEVAKVVRRECRKSDIVARYGGEELSVIIPGTDSKGAVLLAERIRKQVEELAVKFDNDTLQVTISIGVASLVGDIPDKEALVKLADQALYQSKENGRNRVTVA
jgi:diguanylate cyclase (GGDEF)-like protein